MAQALLFGVDGVSHAMPLEPVEWVARMVAVTPLPGSPRVVVGVVNYHGTIVPVLSLRRRFGLPDRTRVESDHLIFVRTRRRLMALQVDGTGDTVTLPEALIEATVSGANGEGGLLGIARLPDGLLLLHDLESVLSPDEERLLAQELRDDE